MFMQIAIGAIGVAIVLFVGYIIVAQVKTALPSSSTVSVSNPCYQQVGITATGNCQNTSIMSYYATAGQAYDTCGGAYNLTSANASAMTSCPNVGFSTGTASAMTTVFAGFGLVAVGIIVLAAFGLIQVFQ